MEGAEARGEEAPMEAGRKRRCTFPAGACALLLATAPGLAALGSETEVVEAQASRIAEHVHAEGCRPGGNAGDAVADRRPFVSGPMGRDTANAVADTLREKGWYARVLPPYYLVEVRCANVTADRRSAEQRNAQERRALAQSLRDAERRRAQRREREAERHPGRAEYIARIKGKIERNWVRPPGTAAGLECEIRVVQMANGEVVQVEIHTSSGNVAFDRSVEEAVLRASPLPLPRDRAAFDSEIVLAIERR